MLKGNEKATMSCLIVSPIFCGVSFFVCLQVFLIVSDLYGDVITFAKGNEMTIYLNCCKVFFNVRAAFFSPCLVMFNLSLVTNLLRKLNLSLCGSNGGHLHDFQLKRILLLFCVSFKQAAFQSLH